jgi:hypothetical protein
VSEAVNECFFFIDGRASVNGFPEEAMNVRYPAALLLTSLMVASPTAAAGQRPHPHPGPPGAYGPSLYSPRALRRAKLLLQFRMLELRKARLERVRKAIEDRIPVDDLLRSNP